MHDDLLASTCTRARGQSFAVATNADLNGTTLRARTAAAAATTVGFNACAPRHRCCATRRI